MKRTREMLVAGGIVMACIALLLGPQISHGQRKAAATEQTYHSLSANQAATILTDMGVAHVQDVDSMGDPMFVLTLGDDKALLLFYKSGTDEADPYTSIQLHTGWKTDGKDLSRGVNTWNRKKRFTRAWYDDERDLHLEADLDLAGGVTRQGIETFISRYTKDVGVFPVFVLVGN
ncbi:MAG TPA: YbjN domain-containing protein [Phycisphaerales bacterium]|nr:YbjN domain-containing protein [Phycisphaerales bacterium]